MTVILVDMDGVIADAQAGALAVMKENHDIDFSKEKWTSWELADHFTDRDLLEKIWNVPGFFAELPIIEGAVDGVNMLAALEYDVFFCTSQVTDSDTCVGDKRNWIYKHFGRDWSRRLIITKDKTLVRGDYLIDDKPEIFGLMKPDWEHIVFDHIYNHHVINKRRVLNWGNAIGFFSQELERIV